MKALTLLPFGLTLGLLAGCSGGKGDKIVVPAGTGRSPTETAPSAPRATEALPSTSRDPLFAQASLPDCDFCGSQCVGREAAEAPPACSRCWTIAECLPTVGGKTLTVHRTNLPGVQFGGPDYLPVQAGPPEAFLGWSGRGTVLAPYQDPRFPSRVSDFYGRLGGSVPYRSGLFQGMAGSLVPYCNFQVGYNCATSVDVESFYRAQYWKGCLDRIALHLEGGDIPQAKEVFYSIAPDVGQYAPPGIRQGFSELGATLGVSFRELGKHFGQSLAAAGMGILNAAASIPAGVANRVAGDALYTADSIARRSSAMAFNRASLGTMQRLGPAVNMWAYGPAGVDFCASSVDVSAVCRVCTWVCE